MKYSIRRLCWSVWLLLLLLPHTVFATSGLPSPKESFYVNDFAKVINKSDEALMIANGNALDNLNGAQIVLVTIDFVGERSLSDFATELFNEWGIGDAKKNNGLLIVMSIGDDDYWAVQGRGLERTLTSGVIANILDNHLEADFADKSYSAGAKQVYSAFVEQLGGTWENSVTSTPTKKEQVTAPIVSTESTVASVDTKKKNTESSGSSNWAINLLSILVVWYFISKLFGRSRRNRTYRTHDHHSTVYYHTDESYRNDGGWFSGSSGNSGSSRRNSTSRSVSGGGGSTRGGGAGRSSSSSSSSSFGSAGGGSTRGGGAGRSSSNSSGAGRSSASSRSTGSAGGGSTRGGGAGRRR